MGGGGLREQRVTENEGFQSGPSLKNEGGGLELKITKKRISLKRGSFGDAQVGKVEQTKFNVYFLKGGPGRKSGVFWSGPC